MRSSLRTRLKRLESHEGIPGKSWEVVWVNDWESHHEAGHKGFADGDTFAGRKKVIYIGFQKPEEA